MGYRYKHAYSYTTTWDKGIWHIEMTARTGWGPDADTLTLTLDVPGDKRKGMKQIETALKQQADRMLTAKLKGESVPEVTIAEQAIILHSLGADYPHKIRNRRGYRNYYCADADDSRLASLAERGLMRAGRTINDGASRYYSVTDLGAAMVAMLLPKAEPAGVAL